MGKPKAESSPKPSRLIQGALAELSLIRPLFHSEADLQHALAWQLRKIEPELELRLERPIEVSGKRISVDIVTHGSRRLAIELKYWTAKLDFVHKGERYKLVDQAAHDIGSYDFVKDLRRLELVVGAGQADAGFAVVVCGDGAYWRKGKDGTVGDAFRMTDGRVLRGKLAWSDRAGAGTMQGREAAIELDGEYEMSWRSFSRVADQRGGELRSLVVEVGP